MDLQLSRATTSAVEIEAGKFYFFSFVFDVSSMGYSAQTGT
jgi:hypothetical protein